VALHPLHERVRARARRRGIGIGAYNGSPESAPEGLAAPAVAEPVPEFESPDELPVLPALDAPDPPAPDEELPQLAAPDPLLAPASS
jgi:hypothetical protein